MVKKELRFENGNSKRAIMNIFFQKFFKTIGLLFLSVFISLVITTSLDPKDACLDSGYCKEELSLNINGKTILINEQTCIENNGKWLSSKQVCKI